jgi:nucleoside-diphosphate-sugar epimerase
MPQQTLEDVRVNRIALVGAGGFVGARFIEISQLGSQGLKGVEIVPVLRQFRGLARMSKFGITGHRMADAGDSEALTKAFVGCDAVVNLTMGDNSRTLSDAQAIFAAANQAGVRRLVHLSSAEVYGRCDQPNLNDDSDWFRQHWMEYAREKGRTEDWIRTIGKGGSTDIVVLRPGLIWGPRSGWVSGPAQSLWDGTSCLIDDGRWACNLCYVDNLIYSIAAVAGQLDGPSGFYNVGDPTRPDWKTYFAGLGSEMGLKPNKLPSIAESAFRESLLSKLGAIKDSAIARKFKRRMLNQTKAKIRALLVHWSRGGNKEQIEMAPVPKIDKGTWWLQTTRYHLPTSKFTNAYRPEVQVPHPEAMRRTGEWLRFSGFKAEV